MQIAIDNNSSLVVELMLERLLRLEHFRISRKVHKFFSVLFKMNLKSFERYLDSCYFATEQMTSIDKIGLPNFNDTVREFYSGSILGTDFLQRYKIPDKQGKIIYESRRFKNNTIAPVDILRDDLDINNHPDQHENAFKEDPHLLKRVSVKAIEFDWIFDGYPAHQFLKDLSDTDNINVYGLNIIRDIVLFLWKYFQRAIFWKLFVPYLVYFFIFCFYTTWLLERQFKEDKDHGAFDVTVWTLGAVILCFNIFWAYVETRQMLLHKLEYFTYFWNLLDLFSVIMNSTVVIMNYAGASFQDTNRVAAISVLVLYFKLFYFLRIFFSTAYLVRMIIEIMLDMKFFITVLMIACIAFANAFYILGRKSDPDSGNLAGDNVADAFIFSFKMGLGDFNTDGFNTDDEELLWIFFLLNTLIIMIILLNLIIAIMGDTFDKVQETQENSMLRELTNMIRENEFLFNRTSSFKRAKYVIIIEPEKAEGGSNIGWEGRLNQLKGFVEESAQKHVHCLAQLQEELESRGKNRL